MSIFNTYFDRIFIINLDSRPDRWADIEGDMHRFGITNYERFPAVRLDHHEIPHDWYAWMHLQNGSNEAAYIQGQVGCKLSHIEVMKLAKDQGYARILVLEDDCQFFEGMESTFQEAIAQCAHIDWDMLYLGGMHVQPCEMMTPNVKRLVESFQTNGYGIHRRLFDVIIDNAMRYPKEVDVYYAWQLHNNYTCLCVHPHIVRQRAGYSDIIARHVDYGDGMR